MSSVESFDGRTVLVTGATSGVGLACCKYLSEHGASLVMVSRTREILESLLRDLPGGNHQYVVADLSRGESVCNVFEALKQNKIKLDGLVHSAGVTYNVSVSDYDFDDASWLFRVNFFSFCEMVKYCSKRRFMNDGASIVAISSIASLRGSKAQSIYAASKAALDGFVRIAAKELLKKRIRVNSVLPGQIDTELTRRFYDEVENAQQKAEHIQELGIIDPAILAKFIAFLLSDDGRYFTGQSFPVDAGSMSHDWME